MLCWCYAYACACINDAAPAPVWACAVADAAVVAADEAVAKRGGGVGP